MRSAPRALLVTLLPLSSGFLLAGPAYADKPAASDNRSRAPTAAHDGDDDDDPRTPAPRPAVGDVPVGSAAQAADPDRPAPIPLLIPSYSGVAPGGEHLPPRAPRLPARGPVRMVWPGFQVRDGVATVFLQLTGDPAWSVEERDGKFVYTLRQTVVPLSNNRRALDVTAFGTVVKSVSAQRHGRDVQVTIELKQKAAHRERTGEAAGGYRFLLIELLPS